MVPGTTFAVLSTDPTFVAEVCEALISAGAEVYVASSWEEYSRIQEEGVFVGGCVLDPICQVR